MRGFVADIIATPPQDVHILTPETYKYVTLHGKRDFADVIMIRILKWGEIILDYLGGPNILLTKVLVREEKEM